MTKRWWSGPFVFIFSNTSEKALNTPVYIHVYDGVYMSVVISIRVAESVKEDIEKLGYSPAEYTKRVLLRELKRDRGKEAMEWLKKNRLPAGAKSTTEMIREDRDSR
jgi:hypothetical protein